MFPCLLYSCHTLRKHGFWSQEEFQQQREDFLEEGHVRGGRTGLAVLLWLKHAGIYLCGKLSTLEVYCGGLRKRPCPSSPYVATVLLCKFCVFVLVVVLMLIYPSVCLAQRRRRIHLSKVTHRVLCHQGVSQTRS